MKPENIQSLERLSLFCHLCGLIFVFLGILVVFIEVVNKNFGHLQVGLFIFAAGYTFVKISARISNILTSESPTTSTEFYGRGKN